MTGPQPGPYGGEPDPAQPPQVGQPPQFGPPAAGLPTDPPQAYPPADPGAPQYAQPAPFGAAPPYGQPPLVRNRKPLVYGGIGAAVIIVAIVVIVGLVSGGGSAKSVAENYLSAAKNGDVATMQSLTCDQYASKVTADSLGSGAAAQSLAGITFSVQDVVESGDTAIAHVKITYSGAFAAGLQGSVTVSVAMTKEHGAWKVCGPA